jgi:hypothetical protein
VAAQTANVSITSGPFPDNGTIEVSIEATGATTNNLKLGNFILTCNSIFDKQEVINYSLGDIGLTYKKDVVIPFGEVSPSTNTSLNGLLLDSSGALLIGWYRYGLSESFGSLLRLIYQQYVNIISLPSVNVEGDIWGVLPGNTITPISPFSAFEFTDITTTINLTGKSYLPGNCSFDYIDNSLAATFLETSDTDIVESITDNVILKS